MRGARFRIKDVDDKTVGIAPDAMSAVDMAVAIKNATIYAWTNLSGALCWHIVAHCNNGFLSYA